MAQTGYTPISIYYSSTAGNTPTSGNLVAGELAINTADGKLFYKDSAGVVQVIGTKGGVGSSTTTQVLYNSSGLVVGSANMTFSGTALTLANDASISGLTVGKGNGANTFSTAFGNSALNATNTQDNAAFGWAALYSNTSGGSNTAVGSYNTLYANTTGNYNTAVGRQALTSNTTASNNTAVGYQAGYSNLTGTGNVFVGRATGYGTTGVNNTYLGETAGYYCTTGNFNTILGCFNGNSGGLDIRTASSYIVLSDGNGNPLVTTYNGGSVSLAGATPKAGTGITFPATQSASSDANTLDDYEEGTWTPTIASTVGALTTYTVNSATYTKIGRVISFSLDVTVNNNGTGSGWITATLPFTSAAYNSAVVGREDNVVGFELQGKIASSTASVAIWKYDNTYPAGANYRLIVSGIYQTT